MNYQLHLALLKVQKRWSLQGITQITQFFRGGKLPPTFHHSILAWLFTNSHVCTLVGQSRKYGGYMFPYCPTTVFRIVHMTLSKWDSLHWQHTTCSYGASILVFGAAIYKQALNKWKCTASEVWLTGGPFSHFSCSISHMLPIHVKEYT